MDHLNIRAADLASDAGSLEVALAIYDQYCGDLKKNPATARARLVSCIQIVADAAFSQGRATGFHDRKEQPNT